MKQFTNFCLWFVDGRKWHGFKTGYCMTTAMTFLFPDSSTLQTISCGEFSEVKGKQNQATFFFFSNLTW